MALGFKFENAVHDDLNIALQSAASKQRAATVGPDFSSDRLAGVDRSREAKRERAETALVVGAYGLQKSVSGNRIRAKAVQDWLSKASVGRHVRVGVDGVQVAIQPVEQRLLARRRQIANSVRSAFRPRPSLSLRLHASVKPALAAEVCGSVDSPDGSPFGVGDLAFDLDDRSLAAPLVPNIHDSGASGNRRINRYGSGQANRLFAVARLVRVDSQGGIGNPMPGRAKNRRHCRQDPKSGFVHERQFIAIERISRQTDRERVKLAILFGHSLSYGP